MDDQLPAMWGIMTDKERAAWTKAHTAAPAPASPQTGSVDSQIADIYARKGGYLKSPRGGEGNTEHR